MRLLIATVALFGLLDSASADLKRQFPYHAAVDGNDVFVRSGPGRNYYSTAKLQRGSRVTVYRHDPGGWYMIAPPRGSFSWIRASYVKPGLAGHGTLTENNVIVRVGSDFGDDRDIEQVRLSTGDTVEILGQKTFQTRLGAVPMLKIKPPRGEYRWVRGRFIAPLDGGNRRVNDRDPYSVPSNAVRDLTGPTDLKHPIDAGGPKLTAPGTTRTTKRPVIAGSRHQDQHRLAALDAEFRGMVDGDTSSWNFSQIEAEYRQLRSKASHPQIARLIDRRLPTIKHYRTVKAEYDRMIQLTSQTQQRDAELTGVHYAGQTAGSGQPAQAGPSFGPTLAPPENGGQPTTPVPTPARPNSPPPGQNRWRTVQPPTPTQQSLTNPTPGFDGAGVIRRVRQVRPGLPRYALVATDGRFLAYLQPVRGLPLERYVGRAMGVYGQRTHRRELGGDHIVVRAMRPVRLLP